MLNTLVEDTLGIIQQAYEWKENSGIVNTLVYNPDFIEFLLNNNSGDNPTTFKVNNIALSEDISNFDRTREKIENSIVLLFSGGLDSFIAYHMLKEKFPKKKIYGLFVNLHTPYSEKELKVVKELSFKTRMDLLLQDCNIAKWMTEEWGYTIPCRNLLLTAIGSYFSNKIYLISQRGETEIADRTHRFFKEASEEFSIFYGERIKVGKVVNMTKQDMVKWYLKRGYNPNLLKETVSCFEKTESKLHCGKCPSCLRKAVALSYNGIDISDIFENDVTKSELIPKYIEKMKKGLYEKRRTRQTLEVFKKWGWSV